MTIYLDVIFLLNVLFDACILLILTVLSKLKVPIYRIIFGSLYAASFVFIMLGAWANIFSHPVIKFIFSMGIIFITFFPFSIRKGLQLFFYLYVVTFSLGGFVIGCNYFFGQSIWFQNGALLTTNGGYGDPVTWGFVGLVFPLACYFYVKNDYHRKVKKLQTELLYDCFFDFRFFQIQCRGLLDTGNQLVDPITNRPVIILDIRRFESEVPSDLFHQYIQFPLNLEDFDEIYRTYKLKCIPYQALGKKNGMLMGMEAAQLKVLSTTSNESFTNVLVAFAPESLHTEDFSCILNPKIWV